LPFFFAISGFLAYYVLWRDQQRLGRIDYSYFLLRRMLRIWPAYLVVISIVTVESWFGRSLTPDWWPLLTFSINFDMGAGQMPPGAIRPLWTIAVEEQILCARSFDVFRIAVALRHRILRRRHCCRKHLARVIRADVFRRGGQSRPLL
jgi:peptidoglycan/LPS O-acetylase OafA/YrhL